MLGCGGEVGISDQIGWPEEAARAAALSRHERTRLTAFSGMRKSVRIGNGIGETRA